MLAGQRFVGIPLFKGHLGLGFNFLLGGQQHRLGKVAQTDREALEFPDQLLADQTGAAAQLQHRAGGQAFEPFGQEPIKFKGRFFL